MTRRPNEIQIWETCEVLIFCLSGFIKFPRINSNSGLVVRLAALCLLAKTLSDMDSDVSAPSRFCEKL